MPRIAAIDHLADRRAAHHHHRERRRALRRYEHAGRGRTVAKVVICVVMLVAFASLGFLVGNDQYQATLIGWVPCIMLLCGIGLGAAYAAILRRGITFEELMDVPECSRDSDVTFTMRFKNRTPLLATRMVTTFFICDMFGNVASENSTTLSLAPFEEYELPLTTRFEHIGTFTAGLKEITVSDFLGLFTYTIKNQANQVVRVIPKVVELDDIDFSNEAMDEATKAARSVLADSMDYAYVREYEIGDPLKTIHWKLSARSSTYMTRLYEVYTNPSVVFIMDFYADWDEADDLMAMFDAIVEATFSFARYTGRTGMDSEVHFIDRHGAMRKLTPADVEKVNEIVGDLPIMSNDPEKASIAIDVLKKQIADPRGFNNIFVISANVSHEMVSTIAQAKVRRRTPNMIAVIPPSLVGRDRDKHCRNLGMLEGSDISFQVISHCSELSYKAGDQEYELI